MHLLFEYVDKHFVSYYYTCYLKDIVKKITIRKSKQYKKLMVVIETVIILMKVTGLVHPILDYGELI